MTYLCSCGQDVTPQVIRKANTTNPWPKTIVTICNTGHYTQHKLV